MSAARARTKPKTRGKTQAKRKRRIPGDARQEHSETQQANQAALLLAWFRLLARCRGAWLQHLWTREGAGGGRATVTHAELAAILGDDDSSQAQAEWVRAEQNVRQWQEQADAIQRSLVSVPDSRFSRLGRVFGLSPDEMRLCQLCAAVAIDPPLGRVCAYLQDHAGRPYLTEELAARLLGLERAAAWNPDMKCFRWELIQRRDVGPGEPHALACDPHIRDWLFGRSTLDERLVGSAQLVEPNSIALPQWPVAEIADLLRRALSASKPLRIRIVVVAPNGGGKRGFVKSVMQSFDMPLLALTADAVEDAAWPRFFMHAQRQAFLDAAALVWTGEAAVRRRWPSYQAMFPVQFMLCEPGTEPPPVYGAIDKTVRLSMPDAETRLALWRHSSPGAERWPDIDARKLAEHQSVWPGDIARAGQLGGDTAAAATAAVREAARSRFGNLAEILDCPFKPDDLILPAAVTQLLEAIVFEAEERGAFWRQPESHRLFPQGRGLIALFSGPSGTGKTMAAQVIAAQLNQDLCRVNLAQLVSKWVGETSRNCEQVIRVAAENNAVLFFDEADAMFSRRTTETRDAQDRFVNTDTAFLLQAIESYPGIAILATNLKSNIDQAFMRRLRYLVEFPKPNAAIQRALWIRMINSLAGNERAESLDAAIGVLTAGSDVTGAQIKLAVLGAIFAARAERVPLGPRHLLIGLDRELAKDGRALGPRERALILKVVGAAA